jgi:predicted DCC family thiol-disulfide oxidoreductase YuxK
MGKTTQTEAIAPSCDSLTVMFDGACPLCRREVAVYRGLRPLQTLHWLDVSAESTPFVNSLDKERFMSRFHVRRGDGELLSGARAFVALWLQLPGWRWLGHAASLPGATAVLEWLYLGFLRIRPRLQRLLVSIESNKHSAKH